MMLLFVFPFCLFSISIADEPILHLTPGCPLTAGGIPKVALTADVPAYGVARCKNGDMTLETNNQVDFFLNGALDQSYNGSNCLFYKKKDVNTFTLNVEVGWGELGSHIINNFDIKTISCAYDKHGNARSDTETIAEWFLNPQEDQTLAGGPSSANFRLEVLDVLGNSIGSDHIHIGRKIRLRAVDRSNNSEPFRAISCNVENKMNNYAILRAGCGDGLIFPRTSGFITVGKEVYSPYFDAFKLKGSADLQFSCNFTTCVSQCDGDSCTVETRRRRSLTATARITTSNKFSRARPDDHFSEL